MPVTVIHPSLYCLPFITRPRQKPSRRGSAAPATGKQSRHKIGRRKGLRGGKPGVSFAARREAAAASAQPHGGRRQWIEPHAPRGAHQPPPPWQPALRQPGSALCRQDGRNPMHLERSGTWRSRAAGMPIGTLVALGLMVYGGAKPPCGLIEQAAATRRRLPRHLYLHPPNQRSEPALPTDTTR